MKKRILFTTILMLLRCITAHAQSHVAEPSVNLGDTSFLDKSAHPDSSSSRLTILPMTAGSCLGLVWNSGKWYFYVNQYQEFGARNRATGEKTVLRIEKVF